MKCINLKIVGGGGSGLLSTGDILVECLLQNGAHVCTDREFPSLIKGGASCYHMAISLVPVTALSTHIDVMLAVDRVGSMAYIHELADGGYLLYGDERHSAVSGFDQQIETRHIRTLHIPEYSTPAKFGGNELMSNMLLLGALWKVLGGDYAVLEGEVTRRFASKPVLLKIDLACIKYGFDLVESSDHLGFRLPSDFSKNTLKPLDGNEIVALSAVHHGVRAYYAYPMSPSSQILMYLSNWASKTGMIVKQAEDEISVVQMALGSMYAGTRALCATSGGGFDLMVETVSLSGMIETPLVIVDVQRPGPATGLPTWSAQGDLQMVIYSGHGEFARLVMSLSDHESIFVRIGEAFNYAEKYQIPVIVLSEKSIAECRMSIPTESLQGIHIHRGLVTEASELSALESKDRYRLTSSGVSKRWLPGSCDTYFYANGDEHREDGTLTEDGPEIQSMQDKRLAKMKTLHESIPAPRHFGIEKDAQISFVGWGSTLPVIKDLISDEGQVTSNKLRQLGTINLEPGTMENITINYLHFDYLWPLRTQELKKFFKDNTNVHLIESNSTGQLGQIIKSETGLEFVGQLLKYDGRRLYSDDVVAYIQNFQK